MRIKELDRTANIAWSPVTVQPAYLSVGTAAQQLDATFSTTSALELYELNIEEPGLDMLLKGSISTENRFHKLSWGAFKLNQQETLSGVIVGGCDGGNMFVYNPAHLLTGNAEEALIVQKDKHTGPIRALDFNIFQENLLASGASDSEILIWDLNNPSVPMTPGARSQPADDVTCIAWNCQVQHILASTFGTRCVVWDLRKNEPIIKVSGSTSRMRCQVVSWHPGVATQMCLASEDDHTPFIQLWDLRFATSPLKTLESHQRGILSLAWCLQDPDLLLSCGKDCRILCWNPNSSMVNGEVVCEIPTSNQWSFDVAWCPRNPALLSSCSFDGHISIYSLMGGAQHITPNAKITEAFMDSNYHMQQAPNISQPATTTFYLSKPPKWLQRPVGVSFGVGALCVRRRCEALTSFEILQPVLKVVANLGQSSKMVMVAEAISGDDNFYMDAGDRGKLVSFNNEIRKQQQANQGSHVTSAGSALVYVSQVVTEPDLVMRASQLEGVLTSGQFAEFCGRKLENCASTNQHQVWSFLQAHFDSNPRSKFLSLLGHDTSSVLNRHAEVVETEDAVGDSQGTDSVFDSLADNFASRFTISTASDTTGIVSQLLLIGRLDDAVDVCLRENLVVEALLLAMAGNKELLRKTQNAYFKMKSNDSLTQLVSAIVTRSWSQIVNASNLTNWKEALSGAIVYCEQEEFTRLCDTLGQRLEQDGDRLHDAMLCYICSGSLVKLVECWSKAKTDVTNPTELENIVEQVAVLKQIPRNASYSSRQTACKSLSDLLFRYASSLANQGKLSLALLHLEPSEEEPVAIFQNRLSQALDMQSTATMAVQRTQLESSRQQTRSVQLQPRQQQQIHPTFQSFPVRPQRSEGLPHVPKYPVATSQATVPPIQPYSRGNMAPRYPPVGQDETPIAYGQPIPSGYSAPVVPSAAVYGQVPTYGITRSDANVLTTSSYEDRLDHANATSTYGPQPSLDNYGSAPNYLDTRSGWNDPPLINRSEQKPRQEFECPAPITHPLYGVPTENAGVYMQTPYYDSSPYVNQPVHPVVEMQTYHHPIEPLPVHSPVVGVAPPQNAKPKDPIPAEHQVLHDLFETMRTKCLEAGSSLPMKRKLEDVSRKLEVLYDKLRDQELSSNTLLGLHQIVLVVQQRDYLTALQIHTQMVSTGAFSEIGGFMPGLKVLLQTAQQLSVCI